MGLWTWSRKKVVLCVHGYQHCTTCNPNPCAEMSRYWGETELLGVDSMNKVPSVPALVIVEQI